MYMMKRAQLALLAIGLLGLAACGSGDSASSPPREATQGGIAIGEPAPPAGPDLAAFISMARAPQSCADSGNRLYVIDGTLVFWSTSGTCADLSFTRTLYSDPKTSLCVQSDSIAGPRLSCSNDKYRDQFQTMVTHLDQADLGLGKDHTVKEVVFLPANGSKLAFDTVELARDSSLLAASTAVIKDRAAWVRLWADAHLGRTKTMPEIDFDKKMVLAVALSKQLRCPTTARIVRVGVSADRIAVNFSEYDHDDRSAVSVCIADGRSASHLVMVDKSDAAVDFVNITPLKSAYTVLDQNNISGYTVAGNRVIRDAATWAEVWAIHTNRFIPSPAPPVVDFSKNMVVGVFIGTRPSGCYATDIVNVDRSGGRLNILRSDTVPGPASVCTTAVTTPVEFIMLERSDAPLEFGADSIAIDSGTLDLTAH